MLFNAQDRLLAGVSGGADSMAMLDTLRKLGFSPGVCHINYRLRGHESDKDLDLVSSYCLTYGLPIFEYSVNDEELQLLQKGNLQEKARDLRYRYFTSVAKREDYNVVCLAHHRDDIAETFLLHALRSSGMRGLQSMTASRENLRRPILWAHKASILEYIRDANVPYREDLTNHLNGYDRNFLRNTIIPLLSDRFAGSSERLSACADVLADEYRLLNHLAGLAKKEWVRESGQTMMIEDLEGFRKIPGNVSLLFIWCAHMDFRPSVIANMLNDGLSGAIFHAPDYEALRDRNTLIIRPKSEKSVWEYMVAEMGTHSLDNGSILEISEINEFTESLPARTEIMDKSKIDFPLELRHWRHGDRFYPLGMGGKSKKISDYLQDLKLSSFEKEEVMLLCDKHDILWIVGMRLSEKVKVDSTTTAFVKVSYTPPSSGGNTV